MNSLRLAAPALTIVLMASGCASTDTDNANAPQREELVYRTGSNIPVRDKTRLTQDERDKQTEEAHRALDQIQRMGAGSQRTN